MTVHVSVHSISALLWLCVGLLGLPADGRAAPQAGKWSSGDTAGATEAAILIRNQRLAVRLPNNAIYQVERVEVGVELAPDTFALKPFTASSGGR